MAEDGVTLSPHLKVIGRYTVLRELRRERHTVSYAATDPVMNRELVVKVVQLIRAGSQLGDDDLHRIEQAFVRQAQAAGRLHHPHIVTVFDAGRSHEYGYLVIERIAGRPLHELLARGLRPAFVQCASIAARVCDALAYAHQQGVAHRHLGPQHVFLLADGVPKVAGFGGWIDSGLSGDEALARTSDLLPYFDNEITSEVRQSDARAAAGLLYMMLTGRAPSPGGATAVHTTETAPAKPLPVQWLRADTPPELARLVDQALDPLPARPLTPGALRDQLTAFVWDQRTADVPPGTIGIPLAAPPRHADTPAVASPADPASAAAERPPAESGDSPPARPKSPTSSFRLPLPAAAGTAEAPAPNGSAAAAAAEAAPGPAARPPVAGTAAGAAPGEVPPSPAAAALAVITRRLREIYTHNRFSTIAFGVVLALAIGIGLVLGRAGKRVEPERAAAPPAAATEAAVAPAAAPASGTVHFDVAPWGEILVNNKPIGVAPPTVDLTLPAGRHMMEIRNPGHASWIGQIEVDATRPVTIRHRFE